MQKPDYYLPIMPYLVLDEANSFIQFIETVFHAEKRFLSERPEGGIMHAEYSLGEATVMFTSANADYPPFPCSMFILVQNIDEIYQQGLANGAVSLQELSNREYGRSAGFRDKFGNQWWLTQMIDS